MKFVRQNLILSLSLAVACTLADLSTSLGADQKSKPSASKADPIEGLVQKLTGKGDLWVNGVFPTISLPATSTVEDVVKEYFKATSRKGENKSFKILNSRPVKIDGTVYEAALVAIPSGQMIILMQFQRQGWWTKQFDAPQDSHQ